MIELKGFITNLGKYNEGSLVGEWVTFPIDEDELEEVFDRIGIDGENYEEYFFTDWECDMYSITKELGEYESIDGVNRLAEALGGVESEELLSAALELGTCQNIIDTIENLDDYIFQPDIINEYDLGYYHITECRYEVPTWLENYVDYEKFGSDLAMESSGIFTEWGWIECTN